MQELFSILKIRKTQIIYVACISLPMCGSLCLSVGMTVEVRGQFAGINFFLPRCGSPASRSAPWAWWHVPLPPNLLFPVSGGYWNLFTCVCVYVLVCVRMHMQMPQDAHVEFRGQLVRTGSLLPPSPFWGSNSGLVANAFTHWAMDWSLFFLSRYHPYGSLTLDTNWLTNWLGSRERSSTLGMKLAYMEKWGKKERGERENRRKAISCCTTNN